MTDLDCRNRTLRGDATAVASAITIAAPPTARLPRWTMCQSFGRPSVLEYWHIGETKMRLRKASERICNGVNSLLMGKLPNLEV